MTQTTNERGDARLLRGAEERRHAKHVRPLIGSEPAGRPDGHAEHEQRLHHEAADERHVECRTRATTIQVSAAIASQTANDQNTDHASVTGDRIAANPVLK